MDFERMLRYCALLERNNNRTWFHDRANHAAYEGAKQDFTDLLLDLKFRLSEAVSPDLAERLMFADPKKMHNQSNYYYYYEDGAPRQKRGGHNKKHRVFIHLN